MKNQKKFVEDLKVVNKKKKKLLLLSHIQSIKNLKYLNENFYKSEYVGFCLFMSGE
jgi:hypothetical protein